MYSDPEAYRVYEAVLPENWAYADAISVLIREKTDHYSPDCLTPEPQFKASVHEAIRDYKTVNHSSLRLARLLNVKKPYELLPESEFSGTPLLLKNSSRWRQYLLGHPNFPGFVELSGVGFSRDRNTALVYMVQYCVNARCSAGDLIVLQKRDGEWKPLKSWGMGCFWKD